MQRRTVWLLSLAGGGTVAGATHVLASPEASLTAAIAASYAAVIRLSVAHPDTVYESGTPAWAVGRWSGLAIGFLLAIALFAPLGLPVTAGSRFGIEILLVGAGYAMWLLGISYARAKAANRIQNPDAQTPEVADAAGPEAGSAASDGAVEGNDD